MGDPSRGLYHKFIVERTDGTSAAGEKHEGCKYFVLDLDHDPIAMKVLRTYAKEARHAGYVLLADDLERIAIYGHDPHEVGE